MLRKNDFLIIFSGIPTAICLGLINGSRFSTFINNKTHLLLFFSYGGVVSFDGVDLFRVLLFSIPFVFHVLLFSNDLHRDFNVASVYIFTRKDTRIKWLFTNCFLLEMKSWLYYIVQFLSIVVISTIKGYVFDFISTLTVIFMLTITLTIMNSLWVLFGCIFSMKKPNPLIFSGILGVYLGWIFLLPVIKDSVILLETIPITRSLLAIHELPYFFENIQLDMPVTLSIFSTCLWGVITRSILYFLGTRWIKNTDLT